MAGGGMMEGIAKSFFAVLQNQFERDPELRAGVMRAVDFVTNLDARMRRIETHLGIKDADIVPLQNSGDAPHGEANKRG